MPIKFCSNCGTKINYELKAPDQCPKCQKSINSALKTAGNITTHQPQKNYTPTYQNSSSDLPESDDIDFQLIDQIKSNMLGGLRKMDISIINIPEFRTPIDQIIGKDSKQQNN